jgi:hypothetical protein
MVQWNTITWYSRLGAIILFIGIVPVLCFYIGTQYELVISMPTIPVQNTSATMSDGQMGSNLSGHWIFVSGTAGPNAVKIKGSDNSTYEDIYTSQGSVGKYTSGGKTLQVLYAPDGSATEYAKDKNGVYFEGGPLGQFDFSGDAPVLIPLAGVDPSTFNVFFDNQGQPTSYSKDKNAVYYTRCGDQGCATVVVDGADPSTFESIYSTTPPIGDIDSYGKDKIHVFDGDQIISGADPVTFSVILGPGYETGFIKDKNNVWYSQNFDGTAQIYKIHDGDPVTFVVIDATEYGIEYAKDKNHVYLVTGNDQNPIMVVNGADPATFTVVPSTDSQSTFDAQDKNHKYLNGQIVSSVQSPVTSTMQTGTSAVDTSTWPTYTDPEGYLTLALPANWTVDTGSSPIPSEGEVLQILSPDKTIEIQISIGLGKNSCAISTYIPNTTLGGIPSMRVPGSNPLHFDYWDLYTNDSYIYIMILSPVYEGGMASPSQLAASASIAQPSNNQNVAIAEAIVQSIHFTHFQPVTLPVCQK